MKFIILGKRRNDLALVLDFRNKRAIVRSNTKYVQGIALEEIPAGPSGYYKAMILFHNDWNNIYFLIERLGWDDNDYFDFAQKRMDEFNILKP